MVCEQTLRQVVAQLELELSTTMSIKKDNIKGDPVKNTP